MGVGTGRAYPDGLGSIGVFRVDFLHGFRSIDSLGYFTTVIHTSGFALKTLHI